MARPIPYASPPYDPAAESSNRWGIAIAVFSKPLIARFGWSISEVARTFTICIFVLGFAAFFGGLWLNRKGPRVVAMTGGALYGLGVFLASFSDHFGHPAAPLLKESAGFLASLSDHRLLWLYITYGVIGGIGLGFGYIVPVAALLKWFPDRRGLITGIAVGGFGAGALVTAPVATRLIQIPQVGVLNTFALLGIGYLVVTLAGGWFMQNPPDGWKPAGWVPSVSQSAHRATHNFTLGEALGTWQWWALWLLLFLNTSAGISVISQESPMFQELAGVTATTAAALVGFASMGNAVGRVFWASVSDLISRKMTFFVMFLIEMLLFWLYPSLNSATLLASVTFVVLLCYGGGFGTMPAFTADYFGPKNVGPIYGLMLTAWGFASAFGPQLIAHMRETQGNFHGALHVIAIILAVAALLPLLVRPPGEKPHTQGLQPAPTG
jgi:OFA family oxalate/formate antiporter-like MFS transporter